MNAKEYLKSLYAKLGPPDLSNVVLSQLREEVDCQFGAFALADHQGKVVLIRRMPIRKYPGIENYWWIPGGGREPGEQLDETVAREFVEETGLHIAVSRILLAHIPDDRPSFIAVTFRATVLDGTVSVTEDPSKATSEVRLFPPNAVPFETVWMDEDKILLTREGFTTGTIDHLGTKHGLKVRHNS